MKKKLFSFVLFLFLFSLSSCLKEEDLLPNSVEASENLGKEDYKPTGKTLKNPYEIKHACCIR